MNIGDPLELLISVAKDLKLLFLVIGTVLIILSFIKISGKIELIKEEDRNRARAAGALFFVTGCVLLFYPSSVEVFGTLRYWDNTPAEGTVIEIDRMRTIADGNGNYKIGNVSRNANFIVFHFGRSICQETLDIPFYSFSVNKSKKGDRKILTISGTVYDEFNESVVGKKVVITGGIPSEGSRGLVMNYTDSNSQYVISDVMCDPKYPMYISVYFGENRQPETRELLRFNGEETKKEYKLKDIYLPPKLTINVNGTVVEQQGRYSSKPSPVPDVMVEMGNKWSSDYTDSQGKYYIVKVPRNATIYNITDISQNKIATGQINPPLSAASPSDRIIKRTLPISN